MNLLAKHFINTKYCNGDGPIKSLSLELYPDKTAFQGVEMSRIGGKIVYHEMYSSKMYNEDMIKCLNMNDNEIIRILKIF